MWTCNHCNSDIELDEAEFCPKCNEPNENFSDFQSSHLSENSLGNGNKMKILLGDQNVEDPKLAEISPKEVKVYPNLFLGRTEAVSENAKFPNWDIEPPSQIINPRLKK